jgi:DNA-binding IclR family transcriptional regulator
MKASSTRGSADSLPAPTVAKTMAVLEALGTAPAGLTHAGVVELSGCSANLVFRVLATLVSLGYVRRHDVTRRYELTGRLLQSIQPRLGDRSLVACSLAAMQWLRDETRETVQLMLRNGGKGIVLEQVSGLEAVQVMGRVGMQIPLYSCAPGKAILAWLQERDLAEWIAATPLKPFTKRTLTTVAALEADLTETRARGYAVDREEGLVGIRCVAAPILDAALRPLAAVTVMAPAKRLPQKRMPLIGRLCIEAANRIAREATA